MLIAVTANTPNSLQHWPSPSKRRRVFHTTQSVAVQPCLSHEANNSPTCYQLLTLGSLPLGQSSPKGEITYYPSRSTILQNFSPIVQMVYEICITKVFFLLFGLGRANPWEKVHHKGRWPGRLLDLPSYKTSSSYVNPCPRYPLPKILKNKQTNSNRYIPSMPISIWG